MKHILVLSFLLLWLQGRAQDTYWQQHLRYNITAGLEVETKSISGHEEVVYKNNSPDSLGFIWFHIWPNAYSSDTTALMIQIKKENALATKKKDISGRGSIEGLSFSVNGKPAMTEPHHNPAYVDIIKVVLDTPLPPGDSIIITTPFTVHLPPYFSRSGFSGNEIMACQWYPKPAVYDADGWHEFPYLDRGEFYSEYGDFTVNLTVPAEYIVGATGVLATTQELEAYKNVGRINASARKAKPVMYNPAEPGAMKTLTYFATNVPDFAWFADKDFVIHYDTVQLPGGRVIDAFSYFHNVRKSNWNNSIDYIRDATKKYSRWIGEYDYPVVQAVEGPGNFSSGGMEYPMITLITQPEASVEELDGVITHEIGHNWFMSMLGSNERAHTWMDEGLNTYYQFRYEAEKYRWNSLFGQTIPRDIRELPFEEFQGVLYKSIHENLPMESAMDIPADQFPSSDEYGIVSYIKTALWMYVIEITFGREQLDKAMQHYFNQWKQKHPGPGDLQSAMEESLGQNLDAFFALTRKEGRF